MPHDLCMLIHGNLIREIPKMQGWTQLLYPRVSFMIK